MKTQRVNPNGMNPMQMNNMSSMMGMMNNIQRIGKGKRKITVNLDKNNAADYERRSPFPSAALSEIACLESV